jgi:glyoxylase-like metal-dependent hydrolase (beta-lactamase superfamily II)
VAEPKEKAARLIPVIAGVVRWGIIESRIGNTRGEAYAVDAPGGGQVLIDPLPLTAAALARLEQRGPVKGIALTIQSHQRSAWRYRDKFGAKVWAPQGAQGLEQKPDHEYRDGDQLPGGLSAIHLPGPAFSGHGLLWEAAGGKVLFCGDLLARSGAGLQFVSDRYMDAPAQARESARRLLSLPIVLLCPGHGAPVRGKVREAIEGLLERDRQRQGA